MESDNINTNTIRTVPARNGQANTGLTKLNRNHTRQIREEVEEGPTVLNDSTSRTSGGVIAHGMSSEEQGLGRGKGRRGPSRYSDM